MATRNTLFTKPTLEIDQDRYEELIRNELKYKQYKACANENTRNVIEMNYKKELKEE